MVKTQEEAIKTTNQIMDEFDMINKLPKDAKFSNWSRFTGPSNNSFFCSGQHLAIFRNTKSTNMISDICAVIECTMDSDYLFTYVPVSPKTALVLVKSKYYDNLDEYLYTLGRFGKKYGNGDPDPFLSAIFEKMDYLLFNSYSSVKSAVHMEETYFKIKEYEEVTVKIQELPLDIARQFNCIFAEDGEKILFTDESELDFAHKNKLLNRKITLNFG